MEHLRYVARARGLPTSAAVFETAYGLESLINNSAWLLLACRRVLERQYTCAPLWWICANVVTAIEPRETLHRLMAEFKADRTEQITEDLVTGLDSPVYVFEVLAAGKDDDGIVVLADFGTLQEIESAIEAEVPVWAMCAVGRRLPNGLWSALSRIALSYQGGGPRVDFVPANLITRVVTADGLQPVAVLAQADSPNAPELLSKSAI